MRKLILTFVLACGIFAANAQTKGDWYVGSGDIANVAWTEWSVSPTIGYGLTEELMIGASVNQADSTVDMDIDFHARYFWKGYFAYASTEGLDTETLCLGVGKLFTIHKGVYVDPKIVYNTGEKTTNLTLGFGLKF